MKKIILIFVIFIMNIFWMSGCGNEKNENTGTDGTHINGTEGTATTDEREMEDSRSREENNTESVTSGTAIDNRDGVVGDVITDVSEELTEMGDDIKDAVEGGSQATTAVETTQSTQAR